MPATILNRPNLNRSRPRRGFTLMEVLVTVAIIILIMSILAVALGQAMGKAHTARTTFLMNSIKQGLTQFKEDIGYYPPVLDAERNLDLPPMQFDGQGNVVIDSYREEFPEWASATSLAEYLLGYGGRDVDGYGVYEDGGGNLAEDESPPTGIRTPGPDGVWNATLYTESPNEPGPLEARQPVLKGQLYGPYIDLKDERLLGSTDGSEDAAGNLNVYFPGDADYDPDDPKVIVDYWGSPIMYFRRGYTDGQLATTQRFPYMDRNNDGEIDGWSLLSDAFGLRPFSLAPGTAIDGLPDCSTTVDIGQGGGSNGGPPGPGSGSGSGDGGDTTTVYELNVAEFGLLSFGPDKRAELTIRVDPDEYNADNIVVTGP